MILRVWRARAEPARRDAYPEFFRHHVVPELRAVPGFLGATLAARDVDGAVEFTVITRWVSFEAIRGFAGDVIDRAVVDPVAVAILRDHDQTVAHVTVIDEIDGGSAADHPMAPPTPLTGSPGGGCGAPCRTIPESS